MRRLGVVIAVAALACAVSSPAFAGGPLPARAAPAAVVADPAAMVNPFIGTSGGFNLFPGPDMPFGMIQWSPDTAPNRHDGGGYEHGDKQFHGFSLTHISGPGCGGYGDIPILPLTGGIPAGDPGAHLESINHANESASPGYYSVTTGTGNIRTELTSTVRTGTARLTYPSGSTASILVKLLDGQNRATASSGQIVGTSEITGSASSGGFCGGGDRYTVFFDLVFDHPFTSSKVISVPGQQVSPNSVFASFGAVGSLQARIGISFVSVANARQNLAQENPRFDFDAVHNAARAAWANMLGKIQVGGGTTSQQRLFYTALYHSMIQPNVASDVNGQYMGFDKQVHTVSGGQRAQYATYSGWDIYRTQAQLSALLAPQQMSDSAQSMINDAAQNGGQIPKWSTNGGETYVMAGDPGTVILGDYFAFGAHGFNTSAALQTMLNEANNQNGVRPGLRLEKQLGYVPDDGDHGCCNFNGSASTLLEYNIADFALSRYALAQGDQTSAAALLARAQNWRNILNPANKFLNPRNSNGAFLPVTPTTFDGYVEGTAAQYRWLVPFNQAGLTKALGGNATVNPLLDHFFSKVDPNDDDTAALHNEPDIGMEYFYDWTGQPAKTQEVVNRARKMFHDAPDTFGDNDDLGAMSAGLVWMSLGMYPATPGTADLAYNSPIFTTEIIHLANGNTVTINAPQASASNIFVQSLNVNGAASTRLYLPASALATGATLDFTLGSAPSSWGTGAADAPPSYDSTTTPPPGNGVGPITGLASKCVTAPNADFGTPIQLVTCNGTDTQQWTVAADGTLQALGMCLDVSGSGTANGTKVQVWGCNGTGAQSWKFTGTQLVNTNSNKCLEVPGPNSADGTPLDIRTCANGANMTWHLPS